jgi:hypothetical protein
MATKKEIKVLHNHLFSEFANKRMTKEFLVNTLNESAKTLNTKNGISYRFNKSPLTYNLNEIETDLLKSTKENRELLVESISAGVENNQIEIIL